MLNNYSQDQKSWNLLEQSLGLCCALTIFLIIHWDKIFLRSETTFEY